MAFTYVTHARTLEELRSEFLSDLTRRLSDINSRKKIVTSPSNNKALSLIEAELASLLHFWQTIELNGTKAKRRTKSAPEVKELDSNAAGDWLRHDLGISKS